MNYERIRIVLNKSGIVRMEEVKLALARDYMEINAVGIIGGFSGAGLAEVFIKNGLQVRLYDDFKDSISVALAKIKWTLRNEGKEALLANIEGIQDMSKFKGADLVLEAAPKSPRSAVSTSPGSGSSWSPAAWRP